MIRKMVERPAGRSMLIRYASFDAPPPMVKDVLIFESDAFSVEPPLSERGLRYDLPLGDDIAAYLKPRLESRTTDWKIDEPVNEDFGAVLMLVRGKKVLTITMSWQGGKCWAMVFGEMRGCIGWYFNRKPAAEPLREIKLLVNEVILEDAERFRDPRWIPNDEFPGVAQVFVIHDKSRAARASSGGSA